MKIYKIFLAIILIAQSQYTIANTCYSIEATRWILGDWISDSGRAIISERWKQVSPLTFDGFGESKLKSSGARQSSESLRLVDMGDEIFYVAKPEQNDIPVAFKLTHCTIISAVFENPSHDFPTKIEYQLSSDNNMEVIVSGEKGKSFSINFVRH